MGRKRCFLRFLASIFVFVFSTNAFAADGYVCDKEYDSCKNGFYLSDGTCHDCTDATNSTSTQTCTLTCSVEHADSCTCSNSGSQTCNGKYTAGNGTGGSGGAADQCTGCDSWTTCSGTCNPNVVCSKNYYLDNGACLACTDVTFTDDGTDTTNTGTCPDGTTKANASGTSQPWTRTCHRTGTSAAGATSASQCTGSDNCGTKNYGTCVATGCSDGYHLVDGACVANTFTVEYAGNGNTGGTNPGSHTCTYGDTSCRAKSNTFTKTNYQFNGWTASCSTGCTLGQTDVPAGDDISNITNANGVTITLTAKWTQKSGSGDCDCTEGEGVESCEATADGTQCNYTWSCKNGYWKAQQSVTGQGTPFTATCDACPSSYNDGSVSPRNARTTCYAKRTPTCTKNEDTMPNGCTASYNDCQCDGTKYTVYSNSAGTGDGTVDGNTTEQCTKAINLSTLVAQANHYVDDADGISCPLCSTLEPEDYYTHSDGGSDGYSQCYHICTIDDVEHARAVEEGENIYYDAEDATCHATECEGDYYLENGVCVDCPDNAICDGGEGFDCEDGYHKNTAGNGCDPNNYTVNYNSNGGTGTMSPSQRTYNDNGKLRKNAFENGTNTFQGWMKASSGDVAYSDEYQGDITGIDDKPIAHNGSITLYAKWGACPSCTDTTTINCTVSVDANNNCAYSTSCKPGYGNEQNHNKVNASCSVLTYNITYDLNQGDSSAAPQHGSNHPATYTVTTTTFTISNPSMAGYVFDGWTAQIASSGDWGTGSSASGSKNFKIGKGTYGDIELTATWSDCPAGSYCDPDGNKYSCTEKINDGHNWTSDKNSDDIHDCYRACTGDDIPHATSYTSDSRFYYGDEAPSQCVAANCESGYEGEDCHAASGITYKVCHYIKNVGASTYALYDNACENKLGTSNAEITLAEQKMPITGFTYDAGFAGISTHGTTKPSSGAVTTTTVLPDGSRVVDLYYNRNTYTLTLTKGTGIDTVTGAGTKEYGESVTINATVTTNYTWSNWTNNNSNNAEVSATKNYPFTMPANNLSYRANAVLGAIDCAAGKTASGTACPKGYYCPERTGVPASDSCEIKCPTDTLGGDTSTDGTGKISNTDCYTIRSCTPLKRAGSDTVVGYGDSKVYYTGSEYNGTPQITVTSCVAGYWLQFNTDPSCVEVGQAAWSPTPSPMCADENSLGKNLCSDLNGGNSDTTTDSNTSGSPTDCYNTCSVNNITVNGEVVGREVPAQEKVYYNGTTIPVCNYPDNKVECETGYERSGHTCVPNVYTVTLNHGEKEGNTCADNCTSTPTSPVYLKYNTGWYATRTDAVAGTNPITTVTIPVWPGNTFGGYWFGNTEVISASGDFVTTSVITEEITADWSENDRLTCYPGTYYKGTGDTCTDCPTGSYCDKEINVIKDTGVPSGKEYCPAADSSNYTPAQTWNGTTLVDVAPGVNSPTKSEDISACYATVQYSADHGKGSQVCHYNKNDLKYNYDCADETILTCDGGYYRKNTTDTECSITESGGYYSVQYDINRTDCPLRGTESNIETLPETGAVSIDQCIQKGRWWTNASGHSAGTHFCYFNTDHPSEGYTANCKSYEIRVCDGGYYVEEEDIGQTFQTMPSCLEVGDGYYSPAQSQCTGEPAQPKDIHGCSMHRSACPATSAYAGTVANDIDSTKTNPSTGTRTATAITQCYLNCIVEKTNGTITQTVIDPTVEYNVSQSKYPRCEYESDEISCSAQTNGQYPLPASGVTDINQCYRNCTQADVGATAATWSGKVKYGNVNECEITQCNGGYYLENGRCIICPTGSYCGGIDQEDCPASHPYSDAGNGSIDWCYNNCTATPPAAQMSGRDYYRATDTCVITKCQEGYYLEGGACVVCPAGSYCDTGGQHSCPAGYTSAAGSTKKTDCYQECNPYDIGDCHLTPVGGSKAYWPNECHYTATIDGNPAELVDGECVVTGCQRGYEMINGECEPCDRENALSYKSGDACAVESCVIGYHPNGDKCDPDILDCTPTVQDAFYAEQKWISSIGQYDICIAKSCNEGFHLASNACVADLQDCEVDHGVGKKTWNPTTNKFGPCIATKCAPGYTSDPYLKNNASQQCSECRNKFSTLGEAAASAYFEGEEDCIIASCIYQGEKYNLDNNECVPICDQPYSDETGSLRWNNSTKKCERTCNPGYMSW